MSFGHSILTVLVISAVVQFVGMGILLLVLFNIWVDLKTKLYGWVRLLFLTSISAFTLKILLQLLSAIPVFIPLAFENRYLIIAYIHLSMIGFVTFFLLGKLFLLQWLRLTSLSRLGIGLLLIGFVGSEFILVMNGLAVFFAERLLLVFTALMSIGILLFLFSPKNSTTPSIPGNEND